MKDSLLESVLDHSPLIYWAIDAEGIVRISRGAGLKEWGQKDGEAVGLSVDNIFADQPPFLKSLQECLEGKEFRAVLHRGGSQLESWFRPVKNDSDQVLGIIGISLVLTELTRTRSASTEEGPDFEMLKKLPNVGIFTCNKQGEIQFANDYFWSCFSMVESTDSHAKQSDYSRQGVVWENLFRDKKNRPLKNSQHSRMNTETFQQELKPVYPGGSVEWVLVQLNAMGAEEWIGTVIDITAIKQVESMFGLQRRELEKAVHTRTLELVERNAQLSLEAEKKQQLVEKLHLSRNYMEAIIRNAVDVILHLDRDGRIMFFNRSITGYDTNKVIGTRLREWALPGHEGSIDIALQKVLTNEEHVSLEIPIVLVTGQQVLYESRWGPIYHQGEIIGATIVARDITRVRELEEEAKERLDELSHLTRLGILGEITATISHELKQPLLAIGNYATGCLHRLNDNSIEQKQVREVLQLISDLSFRARKIVQQTRDFATKNQLTPVQVSPEILLEKSLELVQIELDRKDILLVNELDKSITVFCVDFIQGQQVIVNLLLNAIKAIGISKKKIPHAITVRSAPSENGFVQMTISDTADGIEESSIKGLFNMFHTSNSSGFGMGLSISKKIVESHGGKLNVLQTGPQGTTFEMLLPTCDETPCSILTLNIQLEVD